MLHPIGKRAKRKCLDPRNRIRAGYTVRHNAWQICDLGNPAAIHFLFHFKMQQHWDLVVQDAII
ncbi:MAG: hypothetical protein ABIR59_04200 [Gemmatimonadales bacterium]